MRKRADGIVYAYCKYGDSAFIVPRSEYEGLKSAWTTGRAFWEGMGYYGGDIVIKLGDIACIADTPPEAIVAQLADQAAEQAEDAIT